MAVESAPPDSPQVTAVSAGGNVHRPRSAAVSISGESALIGDRYRSV